MSEEIREREISREEELRAAAEAERRRTEVRPVQQPRRRRGYRSLFWPVVLIAAGVLWLLSNLGIMTAENWSVLVQLWPILLIAAGLDMIVGRFSAVLGSLIGVAAVGLIVVLALIGPSLGWAGNATWFGSPIVIGGDLEIQNMSIDEPLGDTQSADVRLDLSFEQTSIRTLDAGSDSLLEADIDYLGDLTFDVTGGRNKSIRLRQDVVTAGIFPPPGLNTRDMRWDIALNPDVPTDLQVDAGSGPVEMDLAGLTLTALEIDGGSGPVTLSLPAGGPYDTEIDVGSGSFDVELAQGASTTMDVRGGSGPFRFASGADAEVRFEGDVGSGPFEFTLAEGTNGTFELGGGSGPVRFQLPADAAVRVEVRDGGSGRVSLPNALVQVERGDDDDDTGVWETENYSRATNRIEIIIRDVGSGNVIVEF